MGEVTDLAGQHEIIVENLQSDIIKEIIFLIKDFKEERKKVNISFSTIEGEISEFFCPRVYIVEGIPSY